MKRWMQINRCYFERWYAGLSYDY